MATKTAIEWTDFTSNPIKFKRKSDGKRGWACVKVSQGCKFCYAERWNGWRGTAQDFSVAGMAEMEPYLDEKELNWLLKSKKISGKRVFIEDMSDLFGEWVPFEWIERLFTVFAARPDVTFQVLTKRSKRMVEWFESEIHWAWSFPENVWMGVSIDNDVKRVADLQAIPAAVRFLSVEPLIGYCDPVLGIKPSEEAWDEVNSWDDPEPEEFVEECDAELDWVNYGHDLVENPAYVEWQGNRLYSAKFKTFKRQIDWIIVGGESGPGARPMHPDWARGIRDLCQNVEIPFFFKQWGEWVPVDQLAWITDQTTFLHKPVSLDGAMMVRVGKGMAGHLLDGVEWRQMPATDGDHE